MPQRRSSRLPMEDVMDGTKSRSIWSAIYCRQCCTSIATTHRPVKAGDNHFPGPLKSPAEELRPPGQSSNLASIGTKSRNNDQDLAARRRYQARNSRSIMAADCSAKERIRLAVLVAEGSAVKRRSGPAARIDAGIRVSGIRIGASAEASQKPVDLPDALL